MFELLQAEAICWWLNHFLVNYLWGPLQLHGNYDARWPFGRNGRIAASVSLFLPFSAINFHSFIIFARVETTFCVVIAAPIHTLAVIFLESGCSHGRCLISGLCWFLMNAYLFPGAREGDACDDWRQGLSVSSPGIKLWIYWFWLGELRGICP